MKKEKIIMKFPHAHRGVKLIFAAEIIAIVVSILALIAAIFVSIGSASAAAATLLLVSGITGIVVFVIQLVGLFQGARESREFRIALGVTLVGIIASITSAVLSSLEATKNLSPILFAVLTTVAAVADFIVVLCVLLGIAGLAERLGDNYMSERGRKLATYVIIAYIISLIFGFIPGFSVYVNPGIRLLFSIFSIASAVLEIFVYVCTLIYLHSAIRMLEK